MKVYYLNDEKNPILVRILDLTYDPNGDNPDHGYYCLNPAEGRSFDISMPDGSQIFIKKWPNMVMISYL